MAEGLLDRTVGLVQALRRAGLPVSLAESLDAVRALGQVDLLDRSAVRAALAASTVKRAAHRPTFDVLFDLWFPPHRTPTPPHEGPLEATRSSSDALHTDPAGPTGPTDPAGPAGPTGPTDPAGPAGPTGPTDPAGREAWRERLTEVLLDGDDAALRAFARAAVTAFGRADAAPGRQSYFSYKVLRALSPDTLVAAVIQGLLAGAERTPFSEEVARSTARERVRAFQQEVDAEIRRRLAEEKGLEQTARTVVRPLADQVEFLRASREDLAALRRQVHPLARRLATRLAARRRAGPSGRLDMRRTVRASLSTGGVPVRTHHRPRRPHKPELVVLCDVSGSVASFAHFTMLLTWALHEQFTKVRAFAFIDTTDEVTRFLEQADDLPDAMAAMTTEAQLVWYDGHSDYGHALEVFAERYADAITPRTSLLVLGDGRTNYRSPGVATLARLAAEARHAYWLNPEPKGQWGSGDSAAPRYAEVVRMVECRSVAQLERFLLELTA